MLYSDVMLYYRWYVVLQMVYCITEITLYFRWYDTAVNDVYNYYDRNMNDSSVFTSGVFSKVVGTLATLLL